MVKKNQAKTLGNVKVLAVIGLMTSAGVMAADINQQSKIALISETIKPIDQQLTQIDDKVKSDTHVDQKFESKQRLYNKQINYHKHLFTKQEGKKIDSNSSSYKDAIAKTLALMKSKKNAGRSAAKTETESEVSVVSVPKQQPIAQIQQQTQIDDNVASALSTPSAVIINSKEQSMAQNSKVNEVLGNESKQQITAAEETQVKQEKPLPVQKVAKKASESINPEKASDEEVAAFLSKSSVVVKVGENGKIVGQFPEQIPIAIPTQSLVKKTEIETKRATLNQEPQESSKNIYEDAISSKIQITDDGDLVSKDEIKKQGEQIKAAQESKTQESMDLSKQTKPALKSLTKKAISKILVKHVQKDKDTKSLSSDLTEQKLKPTISEKSSDSIQSLQQVSSTEIMVQKTQDKTDKVDKQETESEAAQVQDQSQGQSQEDLLKQATEMYEQQQKEQANAQSDQSTISTSKTSTIKTEQEQPQEKKILSSAMKATTQAASSVQASTLSSTLAPTSTLSESVLPIKKADSYALSQTTEKSAAQLAVAHTIALIKAKSLNQQLEKSASEMSTKSETAQAGPQAIQTVQPVYLNEAALNQQTQKESVKQASELNSSNELSASVSSVPVATVGYAQASLPSISVKTPTQSLQQVQSLATVSVSSLASTQATASVAAVSATKISAKVTSQSILQKLLKKAKESKKQKAMKMTTKTVAKHPSTKPTLKLQQPSMTTAATTVTGFESASTAPLMASSTMQKSNEVETASSISPIAPVQAALTQSVVQVHAVTPVLSAATIATTPSYTTQTAMTQGSLTQAAFAIPKKTQMPVSPKTKSKLSTDQLKALIKKISAQNQSKKVLVTKAPVTSALNTSSVTHVKKAKKDQTKLQVNEDLSIYADQQVLQKPVASLIKSRAAFPSKKQHPKTAVKSKNVLQLKPIALSKLKSEDKSFDISTIAPVENVKTNVKGDCTSPLLCPTGAQGSFPYQQQHTKSNKVVSESTVMKKAKAVPSLTSTIQTQVASPKKFSYKDMIARTIALGKKKNSQKSSTSLAQTSEMSPPDEMDVELDIDTEQKIDTQIKVKAKTESKIETKQKNKQKVHAHSRSFASSTANAQQGQKTTATSKLFNQANIKVSTIFIEQLDQDEMDDDKVIDDVLDHMYDADNIKVPEAILLEKQRQKKIEQKQMREEMAKKQEIEASQSISSLQNDKKKELKMKDQRKQELQNMLKVNENKQAEQKQEKKEVKQPEKKAQENKQTVQSTLQIQQQELNLKSNEKYLQELQNLNKNEKSENKEVSDIHSSQNQVLNFIQSVNSVDDDTYEKIRAQAKQASLSREEQSYSDDEYSIASLAGAKRLIEDEVVPRNITQQMSDNEKAFKERQLKENKQQLKKQQLIEKDIEKLKHEEEQMKQNSKKEIENEVTLSHAKGEIQAEKKKIKMNDVNEEEDLIKKALQAMQDEQDKDDESTLPKKEEIFQDTPSPVQQEEDKPQILAPQATQAFKKQSAQQESLDNISNLQKQIELMNKRIVDLKQNESLIGNKIKEQEKIEQIAQKQEKKINNEKSQPQSIQSIDEGKSKIERDQIVQSADKIKKIASDTLAKATPQLNQKNLEQIKQMQDQFQQEMKQHEQKDKQEKIEKVGGEMKERIEQIEALKSIKLEEAELEKTEKLQKEKEAEEAKQKKIARAHSEEAVAVVVKPIVQQQLAQDQEEIQAEKAKKEREAKIQQSMNQRLKQENKTGLIFSFSSLLSNFWSGVRKIFHL